MEGTDWVAGASRAIRQLAEQARLQRVRAGSDVAYIEMPLESVTSEIPHPGASGNDGGALSRTPMAVFAQRLSVSPPWLSNDMRHKTIITPPAPAMPQQMITPDVNATYMHDDRLPAKFVPSLEMTFKTFDEAYEFYRQYAEKAGFPIKKNKNRSCGKEITCSREGGHKAKVADSERKTSKTSKRGGCKAKVCIEVAKDGASVCYTRIELHHNHSLASDQNMTKRMRCHKSKDPVVTTLMDTLHASKVPHANVMRVLRSVSGGSENLRFTERDVQNRRAAQVREERMDDIPKLQEFFKECKRNNPKLYCDFQLDDKNVVKNVFWSHASQQGDYADYSSVVTFDTTYRTNQYSMPLAMFVGFNNQLQNVVFGQALLRDERADTFEWLFKTFRSCMGGRDPMVILTDQDSSIEKAVHEVLKNAQHRYCRWHVTNKNQNQLNQLN